MFPLFSSRFSSSLFSSVSFLLSISSRSQLFLIAYFFWMFMRLCLWTREHSSQRRFCNIFYTKWYKVCTDIESLLFMFTAFWLEERKLFFLQFSHQLCTNACTLADICISGNNRCAHNASQLTFEKQIHWNACQRIESRYKKFLLRMSLRKKNHW